LNCLFLELAGMESTQEDAAAWAVIAAEAVDATA
jgi:hypothetical protein